ncbi:MAG: hypothetical protein KC620_03110 [Myxococcales bacterium]|nr:hypothetical protein [Myxococcales bacterium]
MAQSGWSPYGGKSYLTFEAIEAWCRQAAAAMPEWISLEVVGQTAAGRPLLLLTVGAAGPERNNRPAFWLDGGTHAIEWTGVMTPIYTLSRWLSGLAAGDKALTAWFSTHTAHVMPCISPDGFAASMAGGPFVRSTLRPPPSGTVRTGLDPVDVDGDGVIRWMRWRHPAGPFVCDEEAPGFMRPRLLDDDPDAAWFVCDEGLFLEWDGHRWTTAPRGFGLDLNRNFPSHWAPFSMFAMDGGAYPLSAPESRAVVDAFAARPLIGAGLTLHTYTGALLMPPYRLDTALSTGDIELMQQLGRDVVRDTGYRALPIVPDFTYDPKQSIVGVWADTMGATFGVPGFTLEQWNPLAECGLELDRPVDFLVRPDPAHVRKVLVHFGARPGVFTPWRAFEHPQIGAVEVGGFDYLRTIRNPPDELLPTECQRGFQVIERLRRALPRARVEVQMTPLGDDWTQVEAIIENLGYLPTSGLRAGERLVGTPPVSLTLEVDAGLQRAEPAGRALDHLDGWGGGERSAVQHAAYPTLSSRSHRTFATWRVRGTGHARLIWHAGRAGRGQVDLTIDRAAAVVGGLSGRG